jgi:hypothetical protein
MNGPVLKTLREKGLVVGTVGAVPRPILPALVVWARREPKYEFHALVALAQTLSPEPLMVFVDDTCSRIVNRRSDDEQGEFNQQYIDFFQGLGCIVKLSSVVYRTVFSTQQLPPVLDLSARIPVAEFIKCLPRHKRLGQTEQHLGEVLHALTELLLFEQVSKERNLLVIGRLSRRIVITHRKVSRNPLSAVVAPRFKSRDEVDDYIAALTR